MHSGHDRDDQNYVDHDRHCTRWFPYVVSRCSRFGFAASIFKPGLGTCILACVRPCLLGARILASLCPSITTCILFVR